MAFSFNDLCALLEEVENISIRRPRLSPEEKNSKVQEAVHKWFSEHRQAINSPDTDGGALLSAMFPHRRKDRVYGLQPQLLSRKLTKLLKFNHVQQALFDNWTTGTNGDLGVYAEIAMKPWDGTIRKKRPILIGRVDQLLTQLAARYRFSDPAIRKKRDWHISTDTELRDILIRIESTEAKWLVRLLLRQYCTIELDEQFVLQQYHFLLPHLLMFQNDFDVACSLLKGELGSYPPIPGPGLEKSILIDAAKKLKPTVGVKVGRPTFHKAWSFKHCFQLVSNRAWAAEAKYDGEYCEIHMNLDNSPNNIQIFSKNGKDATADRRLLHNTIRDSLRIGQPDCRFKKQCIVLGEMVLYSDKEKKILPFSKIRKHISRSGSFMGTLQDSQPHEWEHLMIVFFDIIVLDDNSVLQQGLQERRDTLRDVVQIIPGRSMRSEWTLLDFKTEDGITDLKQTFAQTLASCKEGLILKPLHAPYFPLLSELRNSQPGYFIKLKKDYLNDMGGERDLGDFAIVGASYDAQTAAKVNVKPLHWTHFHLGCLTNKSNVERIGAKPKFKIVGALTLDKCIPKLELKYLNDNGNFRRASINQDGSTEKFDFKYSYSYDRRMSVAFTKPFVAEILGSGYEKVQNENFEMLRHPRIKKIHHDRSWEDTVTMEDLERMAKEKWEAPDPDELDGHAKDVAILARRYAGESNRSQVTSSERETTQETTQCSSTCTTQEPSQNTSGDGIIQETPQMATQDTWATTSTSQVSGSTQRVGAKASREVRILVREDTSEQIITSPLPPLAPNAAILPTPVSSADDNAPSTSKRRQSMRDLMISPPTAKRRKTRMPLKDARSSRNLGVYDIDSQDKVIHVYAEEGWKVQVHSSLEKSRV
ncbi:hypothetical protein K505DRAFT_228760 [Melanomma pulvis-pyrius CBS 109.77]|uniref:ATP-dependent DNA ligase family profile domain-containing protein n=1 Tax=Melanomma pulvis-pyrius CBS 109.77 TaxID=1314802 RepID=A0A6A6XVZ8_9PLEO|nr:hypothetical protein K505DRAFT_228760 [Melanomma pulvis-pyrius CBS 109.77]